ncbi:MAG: hypothetical protein IM607_12500 [Cytophagales bacterium]|nr:hypothetical protein [Cytophagales bacterium]
MADYRKQIGFIKKWEGGMSNDPNDPAAAHPMPCVHNGQSGWHTNKGITWLTFSSNAKALGYAESCENFIAMPDSIWLKIFKKIFWDKFQLDTYRSQAVADIVVSWAWGSGLGGAYRQLARFLNGNYGASLPDQKSNFSTQNVTKIRDVFNSLTRRKQREKTVREELIAHYRNFYISLNKPYYIKGWLNRLNALDAFTKASLPFEKPNWPSLLLAGGLLIGLSLATVWLFEE